MAIIATALSMCANLGSGVLTARVLGDDGRGELAAVQNTTGFVTFMLSLGLYNGVLYFRASNAVSGEDLLGSLLVPTLAWGCVTVLAIELVIPHTLGDQRSDVIRLARIYALTALMAPVSELLGALVMGNQSLRLGIAMRAWPTVGGTLAYSLLWMTGNFAVDTALLTTAIVGPTVAIAFALAVRRRHRIGPFSFRVLSRTLSFGIRSYLAIFSGMVNARLDLFLIPAVLTAAEVGHYSLATSLAVASSQMAGSMLQLVVPLVAGQEVKGHRTVRLMVFRTLALSLMTILPFAILAPTLIRLVYGAEFTASVGPLRVLLAGTMAYSIARVFDAAILAHGRPFMAGLGELCGMVVTGIGLTTVLRGDGTLISVAWVSTIAYSTILAINGLLYLRMMRSTNASLAMEGSRSD